VVSINLYYVIMRLGLTSLKDHSVLPKRAHYILIDIPKTSHEILYWLGRRILWWWEVFLCVCQGDVEREVTVEETTKIKKYTETKVQSFSVALAWLWDLQNHQASLRLLLVMEQKVSCITNLQDYCLIKK